MADKVDATPEALELVERLRTAHGALALFQSAGCCEGSTPMCVVAGELPPAAHDVQLGEIGGVPFYIDEELYERWGRPVFLIDASPGAAEGFSLDALEEMHFVTRTT